MTRVAPHTRGPYAAASTRPLKPAIGLGCFFLQKILPIIVLKTNLQRSPVKFAPICVPMIRLMR